MNNSVLRFLHSQRNHKHERPTAKPLLGWNLLVQGVPAYQSRQSHAQVSVELLWQVPVGMHINIEVCSAYSMYILCTWYCPEGVMQVQ